MLLSMVNVNAKEELRKEQEKLTQMFRDKEELEVSIAKAKRRVAAWAELCDDTETGELVSELDLGGLTEACRTVLRSARKEWMTVADIQRDLKELGFPLGSYKAPAASVMTTVNRMHEAGEVAVNRRSSPGATEYKWAPNINVLRKNFEESLRKVKRLAPRKD
jgi:cell division protein ZapA (FtsZ GTPase activity inhibitor)